jgi:hypothetical protein
MKRQSEIIINVSPEKFEFICGNEPFTLETSVCLQFDEHGSYQFVAIGERSELPDTLYVRLFENQPLNPSIERFDLLTAFMEYGLGRCFEQARSPFRTPVVIIKGAESFKTHFSGYHKFFLEAIALAGGAKDIRFE